MAEVPAQRFAVGRGEAGWRLDAFLAAALGISRARARGLLERGEVELDGARPGLRAKGVALREGQTVAVLHFTPAEAERPEPEPDAPLHLLAEGPGWVAVAKPAGVPVHPLAAGERGSVLNALVARRPEIVGVGEGGLRSGVVHRLDVQTSGVLLFASDEDRFARLRRAFRRHRVAKTYRAIVQGRLEGEGELSLRLTVARHRPARVRVVPEGDADLARRSRPTHLAWRTLAPLAGATLLEVRPTTGFLHQIRVSLAWLGHPILGDPAYGGEETPLAGRHLLHAAAIATEDVAASCPDPEDFRAALAALSASGAG